MHGKSWKSQPHPAMPCKDTNRRHGATRSKNDDHKSNNACMLEAEESKRLRMERIAPKIHGDHIGREREYFIASYNLVHKFIPTPQAMKMPAAKAAVDKGLEKNMRNILVWNLAKVRNTSDMIDEARNKHVKVHFASLMDLCHLKDAELEKKHQKYKGRIVLRCDIVKDDSGSYAVFAEQGSSASQVSAAKVIDIISRLPGCAGKAADAVSAYIQVKNGRCSDFAGRSKIGMSRYLDTSTTTQVA